MGTDIEYDLQALRDGLDKIDKNIATFEDAIEKEHATKREFRHMIAVLEAKQARKAEDGGPH